MKNSSAYPEPSHANRTTALLLAIMIASIAPAQGNAASLVMQTLHEFHYDPSYPQGSLLEDSDGSFYGVTSNGGAHDLGTVYRVTPEGEAATLLTFNNTTGGSPWRQGLVRGTDGNLYGVISQGGADGHGAVFKFAASGPLTTLATFNGTNGSSPSSLIEGKDGNFYGTTVAGGASGGGTVFKFTPGAGLTTLASFAGNASAGNYAFPQCLVQGSDGNFFGITQWRGASGDGSVFKLTPDGKLTTLVSFNGTNGHSPYLLIQGSDGNLYVAAGGNRDSSELAGVIFKMTPSGTITWVSSFGDTPGCGVTRASPSGAALAAGVWKTKPKS